MRSNIMLIAIIFLFYFELLEALLFPADSFMINKFVQYFKKILIQKLDLPFFLFLASQYLRLFIRFVDE